MTASARSETGFTILEVVIAMGVIAAVALGVAQLFSVAIQSTYAARAQTANALLARQKMEQLRALTFGFDENGQPVTDVTTNLGNEPADGSGNGLRASPAGALDGNMPGYVDYLDASGRWTGSGATPPLTAVYIRRWRVEPLPADPDNTIVLHVLVRSRLASDAVLVTLKTRTSK